MVGEAVVLAVGGGPFDHRPLDGHRAEHGEQRSHRARGLEAAVGEQPVIADGDAEPGEHVGDREHEQVLPVQGSAPRQPSRQQERGRRQAEDHDPDNPLGRLVLDRDHLRGTACRRVSNCRDAHAEGPSCARPRSRRGSPARAGFRRRSRFSATTNARSSWNRRAKLVTPPP